MNELSIPETHRSYEAFDPLQLGEALSAAAEARWLRRARSKDRNELSISEIFFCYGAVGSSQLGEALSAVAEARWLCGTGTYE
jgi:hypothetical protein